MGSPKAEYFHMDADSGDDALAGAHLGTDDWMTPLSISQQTRPYVSVTGEFALEGDSSIMVNLPNWQHSPSAEVLVRRPSD